MVARAYIAFLAFVAVAASSAYAQNAVIYVNVANQTHENLIVSPQDELLAELQSVRADALLLYTDYASRAGNDLEAFLKNFTGFAKEVMRSAGVDPATNYSDECKTKLLSRLKKTEHDARRAASYSGDSHHKFLLGHMIVFRMHINKSEDYLKKCDKVLRECGPKCEGTPRVRRWRRLATEEIHRVRDDIQHTKKSYRDLVSHARKKLNHLRKQAVAKSKDSIEGYNHCIASSGN